MFKKWFGKEKEPLRILENAEALQIGDMLDMVDSFGLPTQIRGKTFQVMSISTYEYEDERETEFMLQGEDAESIHMTIENDDGEKFVNFTLKIERDEVERLFDMEVFSLIFDEEICRDPIEVIGDTSSYERWLAPSYRQQSEWYRGFYHKKDYRNHSISKFEEDGGEAFESVTLTSDDDMYYIGIEVWEDGTTDVVLGISRPVADIKALYGKI